jgi:peptide/nickel transport system permease protein
MYVYILRRIWQGAIVTIGVIIVVFILVRLAPGDPARLMNPQMPESQLANIRHQMGLDRPVLVQLLDWSKKALSGDFGNSLYLHIPVNQAIKEAVPQTLLLVTLSTILALLLSLPLGILAAVHRDRFLDRIVLAVSVFINSIPNFWLAIVMLIVVSVQWNLLPAAGIGKQDLRYVILPSITLSLSLVAYFVRTTRLTMIVGLESDYVVAAQARGIPFMRVLMKHTFKNGWIPLITMIGIQLGYLLSGAAVVEAIFNYRGVGMLIIESIGRRDYPMIQAGTLIIAILFILINMVVDISYGFIDPRIRKATEMSGKAVE